MKLDIQPPNYVFCPFCGEKLLIKNEENKQRKFCEKCNWTYYPHVAGAAGVIILNNKKVLMVKRNQEPYLNTWQFPAGFIEYGEHPEDAAKREVEEEVGIVLDGLKFIGVYQVPDDFRSEGHFDFFYMTEIKENSFSNRDREENSEIAWFSLDNLPEIGWSSHKEAIRELKK